MGIYPGLSGWTNVTAGSPKKEEGGQSEKMPPWMQAGVLPKQGRGYEPKHAGSLYTLEKARKQSPLEPLTRTQPC